MAIIATATSPTKVRRLQGYLRDLQLKIAHEEAHLPQMNLDNATYGQIWDRYRAGISATEIAEMAGTSIPAVMAVIKSHTQWESLQAAHILARDRTADMAYNRLWQPLLRSNNPLPFIWREVENLFHNYEDFVREYNLARTKLG